MDKNILTARLRQLLAIDKNALAIYSELVELAKDEELRSVFRQIAEDEKRHTLLDAQMILLLEK